MSASRSSTEPTRSGLDTLSSVCYTIPWRPKKKSKKGSSSSDAPRDTSSSPFPILAEFEVDSDPARVRYASYQIAIQKTEALFDRCMDHVYSSLFDDLRFFFKAQQASTHPEGALAQAGLAEEDLFLPGFESLDTAQDGSTSRDGSARSIPTALLISTSAPYLSSFSNRLVSEIGNASFDGPPSIVVTLSASECSNLYTALRLLVARFIAQGSSLDSAGGLDLSDVEAAAFAGKVEPDLHVLRSWWQNKFGPSGGPKLVLNLPTIEAVEPTVLSDLLSALQTFVAEPSSASSSSHQAACSALPQLLLVLGITSPSGGLAAVSSDIGSSLASSAPAPWIDYIPRSVLRVLDISRFSLPSKELVWSSLVRSFLLSRTLPLSLGPSTFEYVRETYWERDADLDSVLDAVRLACFIHFTGKPESVFTIPGQAKRVRFYSWTPKMVERMKIAFLSTDDEGNLVLPMLTDDNRAGLDVRKFLEEASRSDQFILGQLDSLHQPRELLSFRLEFAVRFLFRAFESLMRIQSRASTAAQAIHARTASVAAQAEMDEQRLLERSSEMLTQVVTQCLNASVGSLEGRRIPAALMLRSGLTRLCNAARRLLSDEFETLLDDMVSAAEDECPADDVEEESGQLKSVSGSIGDQSAQFLAGLRTFQQRLSQTIEGSSAIHDDDDATTASSGTDAALRREARLQRVQRKLLMEEKLLGLKREITDWIQNSVHDLVEWSSISSPSGGPLHLIKDIFWVDCYAPLSTLLDPSTRAGLTLPLAEPKEFIESLYDAALSVVPEHELERLELNGLESPDVCRLFGLYLECGKFVNLGDWYEAFKVSVEHDQNREDEGVEPMTPSNRRKRRAEENDEDALDTPSKPPRAQTASSSRAAKIPETDLQSRFALALNEIARMGMIRGTRRRQEHITKVMWDLVPDS